MRAASALRTRSSAAFPNPNRFTLARLRPSRLHNHFAPAALRPLTAPTVPSPLLCAPRRIQTICRALESDRELIAPQARQPASGLPTVQNRRAPLTGGGDWLGLLCDGGTWAAGYNGRSLRTRLGCPNVSILHPLTSREAVRLDSRRLKGLPAYARFQVPSSGHRLGWRTCR